MIRSKFGEIKKHMFIYILLLPALLATLVFSYFPLPGILMAFKEYDIFKGFFRSDWAGLKYVKEVFQIPMLTGSIWNTLEINVLSLIVCFPAPIILALLLNEIRNTMYKRVIQTLTYLPHFLSWIAIIGIAYSFYAVNGTLNDFRVLLLGKDTVREMFLAKQSLFIPNVLILNVWKETGWSCIIYIAAIAALDIQLYEAAVIDGANRLQQLLYITLPGILPTAMILLILKLGQLFASNFELIYGLQNPFISFEVIATVVFKNGIQQGNYSLATALGFMQGLVAFLLTVTANKISKKASGIALW